ncbi:MAG: hypothetical protein WBM86_16500 [Waterburya sp.]
MSQTKRRNSHYARLNVIYKITEIGDRYLQRDRQSRDYLSILNSSQGSRKID